MNNHRSFLKYGYRFWQAVGLYRNELTGLIESVNMEFELAFPINDDEERMQLEMFLRWNPLVYEGKSILTGTVTIMSKAARRCVFVVGEGMLTVKEARELRRKK